MSTDVTRLEIAQYLGQAFLAGAADRGALLAAAENARPDVREVLQQLPERRFASLRNVWEDLPNVPVGL